MKSHRIHVIAAAAALLMLLPSCQTTAPQWGAFGADVLGCASPGISATVEAAADDLYTRAAGGAGADWNSLGVGLAARYGVPMAICAVEAAFTRLGGSGHRALTPPYVDDAIRWLRANKSAWAKAAPVASQPPVDPPAITAPPPVVPATPSTPVVPATPSTPVVPATPSTPVVPPVVPATPPAPSAPAVPASHG